MQLVALLNVDQYCCHQIHLREDSLTAAVWAERKGHHFRRLKTKANRWEGNTDTVVYGVHKPMCSWQVKVSAW